MAWRAVLLLVSTALLGAWLAWRGGRRGGGSVLARVWRPSAPGYRPPELSLDAGLQEYLSSREDFGVALAGGGTRGMALAHGAVRALREAKLLQRARYLSLTSGSVWLGLPLYYQRNEPLDALLGRSLPPEQLTPEALTEGATAGSFLERLDHFERYPWDKAGGNLEARRVAEARWGLPQGVLDCWKGMTNCSCLVEKLLPDSSLRELWSFLTSYVFLHPFGLAEQDAAHSHETQLERTQRQLGEDARVYAARDASLALPFLLTQAAVLAPFTGHTGPVATFPLEMTPLYAGTPGAYVGAAAEPYGALGDVLVEAFAWPGKAAGPVGPAARAEVPVRPMAHARNLGGLATWAAVATIYAADFQVRPWAKDIPECAVTLAELLMPHAPIWTPLAAPADRPPPARTLPVGDAGIYDDMGHLPLLRRGVRKLLVYDSSAVHGDLCEMVYLLAAFGQPGCLQPPSPPGAPNPNMAANFSTVFAPHEFAGLWRQVVAKRAAGESAVVRGTYTILENKRLGVRGGYRAEVVWVLALPDEAWAAQLPNRTRGALKGYFPNYYASELNTRMEMGAVSQYASWLTRGAVVREVEKMLAGEEELAS